MAQAERLSRAWGWGRGRADMVAAYPIMFVAAWLISLLTDSTATVHALFRPLLVGLSVVIVVQTAASILTRNRHIGALWILLLELALFGAWPAALLLSVALAVGAVMTARQQRSLSSLPLPAVTRALNVVATITLVLVLASAVGAGALIPPERWGVSPRGAVQSALPDVYLVLLDGYPRSDTLERQFSHDNEPFLVELGDLGFEVARDSHTNYNGTELTLASMFNAAQVVDLPGLPEHGSSPQAQSRALTRAINQGRTLDILRATGYEIVTVPSAISSVTLTGADRVVDSGQLTSFEYDILQQGLLPSVVPALQRSWLMDQHRERVEATFDRLGTIAGERVDHPRFVFAHVMAPHAPVAFGATGEPLDGWPCFPSHCSIFYGGQEYGDGVLAPIRDQIEYINSRVIQTAERILANSGRPPVVIFFSDHGQRHDFDDPDEMLRSLFVSVTPGHAGLFPSDMTPVNMIPRLLNDYAEATLPLAPEESYIVDMHKVESTGVLDLAPWPSAD